MFYLNLLQPPVCIIFATIKDNTMFFIRRIWNWGTRFRHRCGYGVHSPSDFFLITSVIYEKRPYYAYRTLKERKFTPLLPHYRAKVNRLLFRLVNYLRPCTLLEVGVGNGASIGYMRAARSSMQSATIKGTDCAKTLVQLADKLGEMGQVDFLHIAHTPHYREVFEAAMPYLHGQSCVVVGNIYGSKDKKQWWKELRQDPRVRLTFDLYDVGLVFFDPKRHKQNYIVNFL